MHINAGTTVAAITSKSGLQPVIQNLGPGNVFISSSQADATTSTGLKLAVGDVYEVPESEAAGDMDWWLVADAANTDVRIIYV